ncbi:MAG: hypothetical protein ACM3JD_00270 [Rudaea sp.]
MNRSNAIAICLMLGGPVVLGADQPSGSGAATNAVVAPEGPTNSVRLLQRVPTNSLSEIRRLEGSLTNLTLRLNLSNRVDRPAEFKTPAGNRPKVGDFWLPGEYEKRLEEKKQERRETGK